MTNKIKFVRLYDFYGSSFCDIVYNSSRIVTRLVSEMPKTAKEFINNAEHTNFYYNTTYKRNEVIYSNDGERNKLTKYEIINRIMNSERINEDDKVYYIEMFVKGWTTEIEMQWIWEK